MNFFFKFHANSATMNLFMLLLGLFFWHRSVLAFVNSNDMRFKYLANWNSNWRRQHQLSGKFRNSGLLGLNRGRYSQVINGKWECDVEEHFEHPEAPLLLDIFEKAPNGDSLPLLDLKKVQVSPVVTYRSDFIILANGSHAYLEECSLWKRLMMSELDEMSCKIIGASIKARGTQVEIKWRVEWIPLTLMWLVQLGRNWPNLNIVYFDILDKYNQKVEFRWEALGRFWFNVFFRGEMKIPMAAIEGTSIFGFDSEVLGNENDDSLAVGSVTKLDLLRKACLVTHRETLQLSDLFFRKVVMNRRIALDMQTFLDTRRPSNTKVSDWVEKIDSSLSIQSIPGMGQFDIDGLDRDSQDGLYQNASTALLFSTALVLLLGAANWAVYLPIMKQQQGYQELLNSMIAFPTSSFCF